MDQEAGEGVTVFRVAEFDALQENLNPFFVVPVCKGLIRFEKKAGALFGGELVGGEPGPHIPGDGGTEADHFLGLDLRDPLSEAGFEGAVLFEAVKGEVAVRADEGRTGVFGVLFEKSDGRFCVVIF